MKELALPDGIWRAVAEHIHCPSRKEGFVFGLLRSTRRASSSELVLDRLVVPDDSAYEHRSSGGLTLRQAASNYFNRLSVDAARLQLIPLHIHSHPAGIPSFSQYDDEHEARLHGWLTSKGQPYLASVVQARDSPPTARIWVANATCDLPLRVGLTILGKNDSHDSPEQLPALERQLVFGSGLRLGASHLTVAIVGTGGIGFLVAEQLARAGFASFVLVDHDVISETNLNRLQGARRSDIGKLKVNVLRRVLRQCSAAIGTQQHLSVRALPHDIYTAPEHVRRAVSECHLVLALTDNELGRLTALELALAGGADFLQAGVEVSLASEQITGLISEVSGAEFGRYCSICAKRLSPTTASIEARRYVGGAVWSHAKRDGYVEDVPAPSVMSLNSIASGLLVLEIQRRVAGIGIRDLIQFDAHSGMVTHRYDRVDARLNGNCAVCQRGLAISYLRLNS